MNAVARTTTTVSASALRARLGAKRFNPLAAAPKAVASKKAFSVQANSDKVQDGPPLYAEGELDIYRESPLRYMGYSNEVGEAFAAFLPGWGVPASYGVAALYVFADTFDKGKRASEVEPDEANKGKRGAIVALDTLTWQMLASVFWPGSFIRCVVNATAVAVAAAHLDASVGESVAKAIPTVAGIAAIPFIVKPIDETVDTAMEMSVTKALNGRIEGVQDAGVALATIGACLAVPPTLFSVASAIKDIAV